MQCSKAIAQVDRCLLPHTYSPCVLGHIWSGKSMSNNTMDDSFEVCVCVSLIASGVKHNAWPAAQQILAEALDPDHIHTGSENSSWIHTNKHIQNTHAHMYQCERNSFILLFFPFRSNDPQLKHIVQYFVHFADLVSLTSIKLNELLPYFNEKLCSL